MTDAEKLALALQHRAKALELAKLKLEERALRDQLVAASFPSGLKLGMNTCALASGHVIKAEVRPSVKVEAGAIGAALELMRADGPLGVTLADRLVKYTPEVRYGELTKLPETYAGIVADAGLKVEQETPSVKLHDSKG